MAHKIAAFLVTLLTVLVIGVSIFFVMLMAMNGYSESDATYGLITYGLLALIVSILIAALAAFVTGRLIKRELNPILAALIAITAFSILGAVLSAVCCIIGIGISEFVRLNF